MEIPAIPIIIVGDRHEENRQRSKRRRQEKGLKPAHGSLSEKHLASLPQPLNNPEGEEHIDVVA